MKLLTLLAATRGKVPPVTIRTKPDEGLSNAITGGRTLQNLGVLTARFYR